MIYTYLGHESCKNISSCNSTLKKYLSVSKSKSKSKPKTDVQADYGVRMQLLHGILRDDEKALRSNYQMTPDQSKAVIP